MRGCLRFASGPHYVRLAIPVKDGRTFVTGPSARMVDAAATLERRASGQTMFCIRKPVTIAPEWDGTPHQVTIVGEVAAAECGNRRP